VANITQARLRVKLLGLKLQNNILGARDYPLGTMRIVKGSNKAVPAPNGRSRSISPDDRQMLIQVLRHI